MKMNGLFLKTLLLVFFIHSHVYCQVVNETFNSGIPLNWPQSPAGSWSLGTTYNQSGAGCILTEEIGSASVITSISTNTQNLTSIINPSISFKASFVKNNFLPPNIALYYDSGTGPQFLARWGSGFTTNTTYTIIESSNFNHPLSAQNVLWQTCQHAFPSINNSSVRFIFSAEIVNGGYLLLDEIIISGTSNTLTTGFKKQDINQVITLYPNPVTDKKLTISGADIKDVYLTSSVGSKITPAYERNTQNNYLVDLSNLPAGVYVLSVLDNKGSLTNRKIIKE